MPSDVIFSKTKHKVADLYPCGLCFSARCRSLDIRLESTSPASGRTNPCYRIRGSEFRASYSFTPYVAKLLNSLSSLPIALFGALAWAFMPDQFRFRSRFVLCWLSFITIGLGSAAFHGTLRRTAQAMDEVPMVYANLVFIYCLVRPSEANRVKMIASLSVVAVGAGVIYVVYEFYAVFFLMYGSVVVWLVVESGRQVFSRTESDPNYAVFRKLYFLGFGTYLSGFLIWITDHAACAQLGVGHLHILWHFLACMGTLTFVLLLLALTVDSELKLDVHIQWLRCFVVPVMPFLEISSPKKA